MTNNLLSYADQYLMAKRALGENFGMGDDLLHVHLGLTIFVVTALLLRRRMRSVWPLAMVAVFAILNELVDYIAPEPWSGSDSLLDLLNTMIWPMVLFLLARRGRGVSEKL